MPLASRSARNARFHGGVPVESPLSPDGWVMIGFFPGSQRSVTAPVYHYDDIAARTTCAVQYTSSRKESLVMVITAGSTVSHDLVSQVEPVLRANAARSEAERRLSPESINA